MQFEPYWSNTLYVVMPKNLWSHYAEPDLLTEHFLVPKFGGGFSLVSPEFPHLHSRIAEGESYDGLTVLISAALASTLQTLAGKTWTLPPYIKVHDKLHHAHDMAVIDENAKLVAPLYQANPVLREFF